MKLEVLISDILDVYRLDIGRLRINKIDVDVEKLVDQIVTEFKPLADDNKIELRSDVRVPVPLNVILRELVRYYPTW